MNTWPSQTRLHLSKSCYYHTRQLRVSDLTLIRQLPVPSPLLSFTPNSITVILSTINSLSLNNPVCSRSTTLLLVLSLKLTSPLIYLPSYALFTGSKSLNASNTSSSHLPTKFSQLPNLHTVITSPLFNHLAAFALHFSVTLARPPTSSSLKNNWSLLCRYASPRLWNQLHMPLRQPHSDTSFSIPDLTVPLRITSSSSDSPLCSFRTPSFFHSHLKTYLFHKSFSPP